MKLDDLKGKIPDALFERLVSIPPPPPADPRDEIIWAIHALSVLPEEERKIQVAELKARLTPEQIAGLKETYIYVSQKISEASRDGNQEV